MSYFGICICSPGKLGHGVSENLLEKGPNFKNALSQLGCFGDGRLDIGLARRCGSWWGRGTVQGGRRLSTGGHSSRGHHTTGVDLFDVGHHQAETGPAMNIFVKIECAGGYLEA